MKFGAVVLTLCALSGGALAQPGGNSVLAEQLFAQGRDLAKAGDWAAACPKFEASLRYDATLGTKLNLATCYENVGKLASAWGLFREAADNATKANDPKRHDYAANKAAQLEPRLPRVTIVAPSPMPDGFSVTRNGTAIDNAALGASLYVDPGELAIVATAPGYEKYSTTATLKEKDTTTVTIPALERSKEAPPPPTTTTPVVAEHPVEAPPPSKTRKHVALGIGIAGVAVMGAGFVFGYKASSNFSDAKKVCPDLECASPDDYARGDALVSDARRDGNIANIMIGVGGAAAVTAVVLWVTSPSEHRTETARITPTVTSHSAGLAIGGSF